jgi:hypothetical protein
MTRRNDEQALRLLGETKRIIASISASLRGSGEGVRGCRVRVSAGGGHGGAGGGGSRSEGGGTRRGVGRYQAAQQAVVLRDQRSWTPKSGIERLFWRADHSLWM